MGKAFKVIEVVGTSSTGSDDAIQNAVAEAGKSLKGLAWFELKELRGGIKDGAVTEYQAVVRIGFRLMD